MRPERSATFAEYAGTRHFPALDGLRAVSILMVLAFHSHDPLWGPLNGYLGVTVFFVISGFLITTLLLREEDRTGRISVRAFYLRRAFRIVPLYVVALAASSLAVVLALASGGAGYGQRLVYFLTFTNEFAGSGTFAHSWSLGIEEKFYLLWPLLAFAIAPFARRRELVVGLALAVAVLSLALSSRAYPAVYAPVLMGCAMALALHRPATFARLAPLASPAAVIGLLALCAATLTIFEPQGYVPLTNIPFALAVTLVFPAVLLAGNGLYRLLATRPLRYVGRRSYAVYLFHLFCVDLVTRLLPEGGATGVQLVRFAVIVGLSLAVAEVLHRLVERPMIALGRRVVRRRAHLPELAFEPVPA